MVASSHVADLRRPNSNADCLMNNLYLRLEVHEVTALVGTGYSELRKTILRRPQKVVTKEFDGPE